MGSSESSIRKVLNGSITSIRSPTDTPTRGSLASTTGDRSTKSMTKAVRLVKRESNSCQPSWEILKTSSNPSNTTTGGGPLNKSESATESRASAKEKEPTPPAATNSVENGTVNLSVPKSRRSTPSKSETANGAMENETTAARLILPSVIPASRRPKLAPIPSRSATASKLSLSSLISTKNCPASSLSATVVSRMPNRNRAVRVPVKVVSTPSSKPAMSAPKAASRLAVKVSIVAL